MKCLICGGEYINLGVHVQKKHMGCDDYRRMFDIPLTTPLADKELCEALSVSAIQRLEDPEFLKECQERCSKNANESKGRKHGPLNLPNVSKRRLIEMNRQTGESYRKRMIPAIMEDYLAGMTPTDLRGKHGVSKATVADWIKLGLLPERRLLYVFGAHPERVFGSKAPRA